MNATIAPPASLADRVASLVSHVENAPGLGPRIGRDCGQRIAQIEKQCSEPQATVVFGGHFSSGKSTLINAAMGRALLPVSDLPETGVICVLRPGRQDTVIASSTGGARAIECTTEAIAQEVSLIGADGDYRDVVREVRQLEVLVSGACIPAAARWIDSPGINDTEGMTRRAAEAAELADVLVWVVNSRQPLSETEQEFLARFAAEHGPSGLTFAVNAFLPHDSTDGWNRFLAERAPYFRQRIIEVGAELGFTKDCPPEVVFVSARAMMGDRRAFGGDALCHMLGSLSAGGQARVQRARAQRATLRLARIAADVENEAREERLRYARLAAHHADAARAEEDRQACFAREVTGAVDGFLRAWPTAAADCGRSVAARIEASTLTRDDTYGRLLTQTLAEAADRLTASLILEVSRSASRLGRTAPTRGHMEQLRTILDIGPVGVPVPSTPANNGHRGWGAILGGILGTAVAGPVGTAVGVGIGAMLFGGDGGADALTNDVAAAKANATVAAQTAGAVLADQRDELLNFLLGACPPVALPGPIPDDGCVRSLVELQHCLRFEVQT